MALKFIGTRVELKAWLVEQGIMGSWELQPNQVFMLRCRDGANLHWAQKAKTLWFSGKLEPRERLANSLELALTQRIFPS